MKWSLLNNNNATNTAKSHHKINNKFQWKNTSAREIVEEKSLDIKKIYNTYIQSEHIEDITQLTTNQLLSRLVIYHEFTSSNNFSLPKYNSKHFFDRGELKREKSILEYEQKISKLEETLYSQY